MGRRGGAERAMGKGRARDRLRSRGWRPGCGEGCVCRLVTRSDCCSGNFQCPRAGPGGGAIGDGKDV